MLTKFTTKKAPRSRSLTTILAIALVVLSVVLILMVSSVQTIVYFLSTQEVIADKQRLTASEAATRVSSFIERVFGELETAARVANVAGATPEARRLMLSKLLGLEAAFQEVVWLDAAGQELAGISLHSSMAPSHVNYQVDSDLFAQVRQGERFVSAVYFDDLASEPLVNLAVPVNNALGDFEGAIIAEVNLKFMWDLVDQLRVGKSGLAYVVDREGTLIAFGDRGRVLQAENVSQLEEVNKFINNQAPGDENWTNISTGIKPGSTVLDTYAPLGTPDWAVVTEIPVTEAYQSLISSLIITLWIVLIAALLAGVVSVYLSRRLAAPLRNLTDTATRIAGGELELVAQVEGTVEVGRLAAAFNHMTAQLQALINSLEERIANRTQRLEIIASLSERLNAILELEALLLEVVNQVKGAFGYYHAQVYLIDEQHQRLVMTAGVGEAGALMKAAGHHILLNAPTSLVARAARSGEVVRVDNVREAADWLPNALLPNTYAEMAVPIILAGEVVGVLDVQADQIGGLDEADANLLRSLASQVAVAMRNARLFAEVETALVQARAAQEKYIEQAWHQLKENPQKLEYLYVQSGAASALPEATLTKAKQLALRQNRPALVTLNGTETPATSIVAPVTLGGKTIGVLQVHRLDSTGGPQSEAHPWSDEDLAIVETVLDQVAQAAENLRLFEETRERAALEQTIREITNNLRAAPSLEQLLNVATAELGQWLGATHTKLELGID